MTTALMIGATRAYARDERLAAHAFFCTELDELEFPAARAIEWLNEHTNEVLQTTEFNDFRAFQTPGRRRLAPQGAVAPAAPESESDDSMIDEQEPQDAQIEPEDIVEEIEIDQPEPENEAPVEPELPAQVPAQDELQIEPEVEPEAAPDAEAEEETETAHENPNPTATRLYTESEIGSPSIHATPDMPVRHGSFSFASLPPREVLQSIRQQSLGLDSDATEDEPVYIRAPELIAHEERMRAYEEPSPQQIIIVAELPPTLPASLPPSPGIGPSDRRTRSMTQREHEEREEARINELRRSMSVSDDEQPTHTTASNQPTVPAIQEEEQHQPTAHEQATISAAQQEEPAAVYPVLEDNDDDESTADEQVVDIAPQEGSEEASQDEQSSEELGQESTITQQANDANTAQDTANGRSRLRAPPRNLGRPVRPTTAASTTQHIRINSLVRPRPVNTAPVAVHNSQETRRVRSKPPTQFVRPAPRPQAPAPKSFTAAQRKKEADERAAERDAARQKLQKERRDNKHEELRTKKREEQEAADAEARRKSNEFAEKHLRELDMNPIKRAAWETRQEREEAAVAEEKRINREKIINRQNNLQGRLYGSSSIRPTMLELNQPARPASRLEMRDIEMAQSNNENTPPAENAPQRSVHDQVTRASTRPAAAPQRPLQRQSQQEAALPAYPSSLHRAPLRGSALQRPGSIFQNTTQPTASTISAFPAPPTRVPDMRQYATQRPPMANELPTQPQQQQPQPQSQRIQPPQAQSQASSSRPPQTANRMRLVQAIKESSPIPSNISLPEIHTDSSDEDSDRASLPSWVSPGHVFQTLASQETYDTDRIFGPIKRVAIDDVFGTMPAEKRQRLNLRTSSANWVRTGDALTQVEVIEDRAGREAIRNAGGWVYGISDYHNHELRTYNNTNNNHRNMN